MIAALFGVCFSPYAFRPALTVIALLLTLDTCYVVLFDRCRHIGAYLPIIAAIGVMALVYLQAFAKEWADVLQWVLIALGLVLFLLLALMFLSAAFIKRGKADYLFVLGAASAGRKMSATMRSRADAAIKLLKENPGCRAVLCGGKAKGEQVSEAELMREYLVSKGVDEHRLLLEDASVNTAQNFRLAREKLFPASCGEQILIVTSVYHLFRARLLARKAGFSAYGLPVFRPLDILLNNALREAGSLVKYALFEWIILPARRGGKAK